MNRRRSEGPISNSLVQQQQHQQPQHQQQHYQQQYHQQQHHQQLPSTKSSPNLAKPGDDQTESNAHTDRSTSLDQTHLTKSSPSLVNDAMYKQYNMDIKYPTDISSDFIMRQSGYAEFGDRAYSGDLYPTGSNSPRQNVRRSLPAHSLHRYQPDYENVSHLGTAPLRSEKISEIEDIEEVTGRDSNPHTPDVKEYDPFQGTGIPTRDPTSLKYIKVNQNHEKYPSWPVTKSSGPTEQTQPINSRAQSMTDHTSTSKEFPKKQQLAYTPGLRPLAEKNSPTSERKTDDGKTRNGSDPGFKSEFVYGRYGRVQRRDMGNTEGRFDDFYNNSKPGYPPPNLDPDGRNFGDKEYKAPLPPEKESTGVDYLSHKLGNFDGSGKTDPGHTPQGGAARSHELSTPLKQMNASTSYRTRPSELKLNVNKDLPKQNLNSSDTGTSPLEKGSPLFSLTQRDMRASSQGESLSTQQGRHQPFYDNTQSRHQPFYDNKQNSPQQEGVSYSSRTSSSTHSQTSHIPAHNWRSSSQKDHVVSPKVNKDRPSSSYERSTTHSDRPNVHNLVDKSGDKSKTYIVKSTPYYNTSTQTDMLPYAIKISDPSSAATNSKHAEIQVGGYSSEALQMAPSEGQRKHFEEKSMQARVSRDFESSDVESRGKMPSLGSSFGANGQSEDFSRYSSSVVTTSQTFPFKGIQSIHAKYATDEQSGTGMNTDTYRALIPTFNDNASMLRKLSEEFYGTRLGLTQDKRMSSSSQDSTRCDSTRPVAVLQPGMREAESYSSIVIHHDEKIGLFGGDDVSSVSSFADSRHDISSVHCDSISNLKNTDILATAQRGSMTSNPPSQRSRLDQTDPKPSASKPHTNESSGPGPSSSAARARDLPGRLGKVSDHPNTSSPESDASQVISNSRTVFSDARAAQNSSVSGGISKSPFVHSAPQASRSSAKPANVNEAASVTTVRSREGLLESDFAADDDGDEDDLSDYEFSRKPSMRKAYGIYDETERLISQSKVIAQASKTAPERQAAQSKVIAQASKTAPERQAAQSVAVSAQERQVAQSVAVSAQERQAAQSVAVSVSGSSVPTSRGRRFSESLGLGRIQEESDAANAWTDLDGSLGEKSVPRKSSGANERLTTTKSEKIEKYQWQNEAWLKSQASVPAESNLRRTASEQIATPRQNLNVKVSSYDTDGSQFQRTGQVSATAFPTSAFPASAFHNYDSKQNPRSPSVDIHSTHSRIKFEDFPQQQQEQTLFTQQDSTRYYGHKTDQGKTGKNGVPDSFPVDSSVYESISGAGRSPSESVADVICKVNENLAKSAERVDSIRRSNSSSSRSSSDYMDMTRDRNRKETDWTRLRTSGSLRYSPDHERRSSRSSFASENLYEDISAFALSTPRSSFAENTDKMVEKGNSNASMDSGLVASPTYQNFPYQRRAPPVPPRSPSPDETPPALPPRKYRENQQSDDADITTTSTPNIASMPPGFPNETSSNDLPNSRQPSEEIQVDRTKRDFKTLMTQWENNTPRVDRYAAELRKQAQKFSNNQQQHANAMPASYERTKTKISFSTTYKHEPMQPQEATSPLSSSLPPSSPHPNISTAAPTSFYGAPLSSSSSSPHPSTNFHLPPSSSPHPSTNFHLPPSSKNSNPPRTTKPESCPSPNDNSTSKSYSYPASVNSSHASASTSVSSSIIINPGQVKTPERSKLAEDFRNRSGSDVLHTKPPISGGSESAVRSQSTAQHQLRERSSSEHDILSERRERHHSGPRQANQDSVHGENAQVKVSKWRSGRAGGEGQLLPAQTKVEIVSMKDGNFSPPPIQTITTRGESKDSEGFADESYIGHKNKSSRAIGTYKRSKSAVVLETSGGGYKDTDPDAQPFQDPKLSHQSWSSESVLSRTDAAVDQGPGWSGGDRTAPEYRAAATSTTPVRPSRSIAHGRHSVDQLQTSSLNYSSAYQNSNSSAASSSDNGFASQHFDTDQPSHETHRESPQCFPPSLSDPSYEPHPHTFRQQGVKSSNSPHSRPDDGAERGHPHNTSPFHYSKNHPNDVASGTNSWTSHNSNYSTTPSPTSSQAGPIYCKPGDSGQLTSYDNPTTPAVSHQRRESVPVRLPASTTNPESKLDIPLGDATGISRRQSDSNVNSAQWSDQNSYDTPSSSHSRQPSQEELECDEKAKELAQELTDKEHKLSEVLRFDANKKRMQYMDGLFSESSDASSSLGDRLPFSQVTRSVNNRNPQPAPDGSNFEASKRSSLPKEYWMSPSRALLEMELRRNEETSRDLTKDINDSTTLMKHKEELMGKLHKKLEVLKEEKMSLQQEISDNNSLGKQVFETVEVKCQSHSERDKIKAYIDDLEKIVRLLLNLSGQLARAENAVQSLGPQVDAKLKKLTIDKRERLFAKYEEAKFLKEDIDKRSDQLSGVLRDRLSDREFSGYTHFIKMKSKLTIDLQELDDKITLGEEQILALGKSIPDQTCGL